MLLFLLASCWLGGFAIVGGNLNNDFVANTDTGWDVSQCGWVSEHSPSPQEQVSALGLEIQIVVDGEFNGDGSIIGVETELSLDADTVTIRPIEPLLANTTYTWWLDTGCQYVESTFVTSAYGGELSLTQQQLSARSFDLMMLSESTVGGPKGQDAELERLLRGWVWARGSMDEQGHLSLAQVDASAQDFCASTQVLQGYFNYPLPQVSWIGSHVILASDLGALDMEELRIDALIAPDGQSLGEVTLSGLIGATQLSSYFGVDYCQSMSAQGSPCVGCQDPQGCARVRVEQATGRVKESVVQAVDEAFCHEQCEENSQDCELE